jgi:DNA ligase-1
MALDGELFLERGQFQQTMSIVRCHDPSKRDWSRIKYMVFDAPEVAGTASDRLSHAAIALLANPWAKIVPHRACTGGVPEVMAELQRVLALGGEGVMLKHPTNPYTGGRNSNHLKVKEFNDAEAVVVGHEPGKGKHTGRMGALLCADECGREIRIGTGFTDAQRTVPPEVGALITYKYQNKTDDGLPRFPVFMRERWPE